MATGKRPAYFSDGIAPVHRNSRSELFFITIEARPEPDSDSSCNAGGAFVNCWVDSDDLRTAERRCVALMEEAGWTPYRFEKWSIVTHDDYPDMQRHDDGGLNLHEIVEQAFIDGETCVIPTWPVDAPDADET